jgi:hypothetical protein
MGYRLFSAVLTGFALGGCAQSAIDDDLDRDAGEDMGGGDLDAGTEVDSGSEAEPARDAQTSLDASDASEADTGVGRPEDAGAPPSRDAGGGMDSGGPSARPDASMDKPDTGAPKPPDAGTDAGKPPVTDAGMTCAGGTQQCGGQCVDTKASNQHCGACGTVCAGGQTCSDSKCSTPVVVPSGCTAKSLDNRDYLFCTNARTWTAARQACIEVKMDLAVIGNSAESDFIKGNGDSWFGASDLDDERTWRAPTLGNARNNEGPNLAFQRWASGEPSNTERCDGIDIFVSCLGQRTDEDCGMVRSSDGQWNDAYCEVQLRYVCEEY